MRPESFSRKYDIDALGRTTEEKPPDPRGGRLSRWKSKWGATDSPSGCPPPSGVGGAFSWTESRNGRWWFRPAWAKVVAVVHRSQFPVVGWAARWKSGLATWACDEPNEGRCEGNRLVPGRSWRERSFSFCVFRLVVYDLIIVQRYEKIGTYASLCVCYWILLYVIGCYWIR